MLCIQDISKLARSAQCGLDELRKDTRFGRIELKANGTPNL